MGNTTSLGSMLSKEILSTYSSMSQFAKKSGLTRSTLSLIFREKEPKPISVEQLIKITLALGYAEEHFFDLYIDEYFNEENLNKSRIVKLLCRCGELGLHDHSKRIIEKLSETPSYIPVVFDVAEQLNKEKCKEAALFLYHWITGANTEVSISLLAVCHYRIFRLQLSIDSDHNLHLLYRFLPYKSYLPTHLNLDALISVLNVLSNQQQYEERDLFANELISICIELFGTEDFPNTKNIAHYVPLLERHPVVYYGRGYLSKQSSLEGLGQFQTAQFYCKNYEALYWFDDGSAIAKEEIEKLSLFAKANECTFKLLQGDLSILPEYMNFLEEHPKELIRGLITILQAANEFEFSIDPFLKRVEARFDEWSEDTQSYYIEMIQRNDISYMLYHLAIYHFNAGRIQESLDTAINCWTLSQTINNQHHFQLLASLTALYNYCDESTNQNNSA
ncbi:helix-turn-helix domain-containing protein [Saccharibacillus kuerlensis]|uniref:HTH cro/C1-type domain-containing protein n=1 Tax=Saccharibacillus kuerlensis TaxID=459527 RepID=A0ABQ2KUU8_9BACL|nr:helix-turn-helix transcriptional regulator [Saccharibacillus kuerlensis]GGN93596.1 hypothetical protein GCM10010969_07530 [Saccharibacillus kuerlensis]